MTTIGRSNGDTMDKEQEVRATCREHGLTCRRHPTKGKLCQVVDRDTKTVVIDAISLAALHRACMAGFIDCYDKETRTFNRGKLKNYELFE